jgi:cathepsin A (carboxypeptidase C)
MVVTTIPGSTIIQTRMMVNSRPPLESNSLVSTLLILCFAGCTTQLATMATAANESTPLTSYGPTPTNSSRPLSWGKRVLLHVAGLLSLALVFSVAVVIITRDGYSMASVRSRSTASTVSSSADEITGMPGMPSSYTRRLFSGYLPIHNGGEGFYFFAESQSDTPEKDPVLLWLNGGPGGSSLTGCFSENGPLLVDDEGKTLRVNDYAWNKNANMVCIESPVGVGFTYNASGVYASDDTAQADDLYWMLQTFFSKFPWLRENDFIISGESYGGIYVPMTAKRIVEGNQKNDTATKINLTKFAVGNGANEFLTLSKIAFAYYHGLISTEVYKGVAAVCPALLTPGTKLPDDASEECVNSIQRVAGDMQSSNVNNYNVYAECAGGDSSAGLQSMIDTLNGPLQAVPHPVSMSMSVCLNFSPLNSYFNLPQVRKAFHTRSEVAEWHGISLTSALDLPSLLNKSAEEVEPIIKNKVLRYEVTQQMVVTPLWRFLIDHGVEGVIYHGDVDMACDFIGGLWAVESLQLPRKSPRSAWTVKGDDQTAGFVEDFGMLKYVTVKGSGHMVPTDKPKEAKAMLDQFVLN